MFTKSSVLPYFVLFLSYELDETDVVGVAMEIQVLCDHQLSCLWLSTSYTHPIFLSHSVEQGSEKQDSLGFS